MNRNQSRGKSRAELALTAAIAAAPLFATALILLSRHPQRAIASVGPALIQVVEPVAERESISAKCLLFPDGIQELAPKTLRVLGLRPVLMHCEPNGTARAPASLAAALQTVLAVPSERIAIRRMSARNTSYLLLVDTDSMRTELAQESCFKCVPIAFGSLEHTRYGSAVSRLSKDYKRSKLKHALLNAGLKAAENDAHGAIVTADLCPTVKPMNRSFFEEVEGLQKKAPVALSVSGVWMDRHRNDLEWLKRRVRDGKLDVTWVNHSHHHAFRNDHTTEQNYMLLPKMNIEDEIVENERIMIENGLTPSVFFRFPALVSDPRLMEAVKNHMLIPLAANAWLAQGQQPHDHSIILVHANGNEKGGLARFKKLADEKQLPLPIIPLLDAPRAPNKTSQ